MRIVMALVAVLYVLAAFYGYFWWNDRHNNLAETHLAPTSAPTSAAVKPAAEQLRFPEVKLAEDTQLRQQLQIMQATFDARLQALETKQASTLSGLQKQLDELKQQQAQVKLATSSVEDSNKQITANALSEPPPTEQILETQAQQAKLSLKAQMGQLDLKLQADTPDIARQSVFQQKVESAFNQAELSSLLQTRAECGQTFCKLDIQGQVPAGVDALQALWEHNVFPESTEVMTVPKLDGSGWLVYIAADGQSLTKSP